MRRGQVLQLTVWRAAIGLVGLTSPVWAIDAETVIQQYLDAIGGKAALEKIKTRVIKGTFALPDMGIYASFESYTKPPDKYRLIIDFAEMGSAQNGVNGDVVWTINPMTGPRILTGGERLAALRQAQVDAFLNWKQFFTSAEASGPEALGDQQVIKVVLTPQEGEPLTCYFDADTHLLVRMDSVQDFQNIQTRLSDYREVDGVKLPHKMVMSSPQFSFELQIESVEHNVEIPDDKFALPPEIAQMVGGSTAGGR